MANPQHVRERPSLESLQAQYTAGNQQPLHDLLLAFKGIKELPANHHHSFYRIASYHGYGIDFDENAPIPESETNFNYVHSICPHATVIFPTWHRFFVLRLERALQFINPNVMMPFWDEIGEETLAKGIPWALTLKQIKFGDQVMDNPLYSFVHPYNLRDPRNQTIYKPAGVGTVRFPLCGSYFESGPDDVDSYNSNFPDYDRNSQLLNNFLVKYVLVDSEKSYLNCLKVKNYDSFSNTRSVSARDTSLETPHNTFHVAVGSVQAFIPDSENIGYDLASGDLASVPIAAFDPLFFFHHCFVDRIFWEWQSRHNAVTSLPMVGNRTYNLNTPLRPFKKEDGTYYTSVDSPNISNLGYSYPPFQTTSANAQQRKAVRSAGPGKEWFSKKILCVSGIDRSRIRGSFTVEAVARAKISKTKYYLGKHAVFSRVDLENCENCMETLDITIYFPMKNVMITDESDLNFDVKLRYKKGVTFESLGVQPTLSVA